MDAIEIAREDAMRERGRRRAKAAIAKAEERGEIAETPAGTALLAKAITPLTEAIAAFVAEAKSGKAGRRHQAVRLLEGVNPELAAYVTVRACLTTASKRYAVQTAALMAARALEMELIADAFEGENKALYRAVVGKAKSRGLTPQRIAKAVELANKHFEVTNPQLWTTSERVHLGTKLVDLVVETLGIVKSELVRTGKHKFQHQLSFTAEVSDWYKRFNDAAALSKPLWLPTVAPPKPWETVRGGGYYTDRIRAQPLLTRAFTGQMEKLKEADMKTVYAALNGLQETPWAINARVLAVMADAWERGLDLPGLPKRFDEPLPEKPEEVAEAEKGSDIRKEWRQKVRLIHQGNAQARSDRFTFDRLLDVAKENVSNPAIYFPHRLDFRGRCYAMSTALNPQGPDEARALLHFAEGKALGSRGAYWLGVHGANLFGNDKVSLEDRFTWACAQIGQVHLVARDPLDNLWWTEADKPWCFLAWCFEWSAALSGDRIQDYVSHQAIALDGSCNGIQHYSAMLRDEVGGKAVNLVPGDKPNDIYQAVADRVNHKLEIVANKEDDPNHHFAYQWLRFGVNRKITKRAVMVLPYGGTFKSCLDYVSDATNERFKEGAEQPFGDELRKAQGYLAALVWEAIGDVVIAARAGMNWLQKVARVCNAANVPLTWETPTGFVVVQDYRQKSGRRIETRFQGSVVKFRDPSVTDAIDGAKQASAIAPNFVHSLDASALMLTIIAALEIGIKDFAMIHDSYGTHAANTESFARLLREAFAGMYYSHDVLAEFKAGIEKQLPAEYAAKLPPLPAKGNLNLNDVVNSAYFFA